MIKLFRKIRQNLLSEGKPGKYLKYAIGEILLVVIGILIALALNNWNEKRHAERQVLEVINRLEEDLIYNFNDATKTLNFFVNQEKICLDVLQNKLKIKDYQNDDLISIVSVNWTLVQPKSENLDELIENQKLVPKLFGPLVSAAKILKDRENIMDNNWKRLNTTIQENIRKMTKEVSLIRLDSISIKEKFRYMLTNEEYKKIIELYWIDAQDYSDMVSRYRAQVMATLSTIKVLKDNYKIEDLKKLYKSNGMNPFIENACYETPEKSEGNFLRRGYLIGNISAETVTLKAKSNNVNRFYTLQPMSFSFTRPEYAGIGGDHTVIIEHIDNENTCIKKFSSVRKGYLIIE